MITLRAAALPDGSTRMTVVLGPDEEFIVVSKDRHYKLGEPMHEDVLAGHIIAGVTPTRWCSLEQKWIDA